MTTDQASYQGGDNLAVTWTVNNSSTGQAKPAGWVDRVYLSTHADPFLPEARRMILGEVRHNSPLDAGPVVHRILECLTLAVGPAGNTSSSSVTRGPVTIHKVTIRCWRSAEDNNAASVDVSVTAVPADLVVSDVSFEPELFSGEPTTIRYTVTNAGSHSGP